MTPHSVCLRTALARLTLAFVAIGALAVTASPGRSQDALRVIQPNEAAPAAEPGLAVRLYIDAKKNNQFKDADSDFNSFTYTAKMESGEVVIRLDNAGVLDQWKGNGTITATLDGSSSYFEEFDAVRAGVPGARDCQ